MKFHFIKAFKLTLFTILLLAVAYPLALWEIARITPHGGAGEIIVHKDRTYFANVGQSFTDKTHFWSRPSAVGYNAAGSGGSNKGPSNEAYLAEVRARIDTFLVYHPGVRRSEVPVEMVTASGSGLDPDISPDAANIQVPRVAAARGIAASDVYRLVQQQTRKPVLGMFGTERVNVLKLNLALDDIR